MNDYYPPHEGAVIHYGANEQSSHASDVLGSDPRDHRMVVASSAPRLDSIPSADDLEAHVQQLIRMAGAGE